MRGRGCCLTQQEQDYLCLNAEPGHGGKRKATTGPHSTDHNTPIDRKKGNAPNKPSWRASLFTVEGLMVMEQAVIGPLTPLNREAKKIKGKRAGKTKEN